ncbi:MAG: hypothetical protein JWO63_682 [Frankiales bacterium]|nr:hypothetical protein [Frankiales bacterium]
MLWGALVFVGIIFWLWAIFDSLTADRTRVRLLPKIAWVVLIVVLFELTPLPALAWVLLGRPRGAKSRQTSGLRTGWGGSAAGARPGRTTPSKSRPIGPDDDPDFLSGLGR